MIWEILRSLGDLWQKLGGKLWGKDQIYISYYVTRIFFFFFFLLGLHPWPMEVPRLVVESELQLQAYSTATATPYLRPLMQLSATPILNGLSEARD